MMYGMRNNPGSTKKARNKDFLKMRVAYNALLGDECVSQLLKVHGLLLYNIL